MSAKKRWFSWFPILRKRIKYGILSCFVGEDYVKQTHAYEDKVYEVGALRKECDDLQQRNIELESDINRLEEYSSLESSVDYLQSEIDETTKKLCDILDNYQKLTEKHNVKGNVELPPLEELKKDYQGRMKAIDLLSKLHDAKNNIILHLKKENSRKDRVLLELNQQFENYKVEIAKQLAAMEPRERLVSVFEHADDSFFILSNNFHVEYVSKATKVILRCEKEEELGDYINKNFSHWFADKKQYTGFEKLVNQAALENKRFYGNFEFEIDSRKKTTIPLIADIEIIRIGYDEQTFKGFLVLIDRAKYCARIKAYAKKQLEKLSAPENSQGEINPEPST
ncbi:hypothetical protein KY312_01225 [Candidatus Woesearchaeota archaeon]|nr:hypothetical protein [Candidatus Woesearchaeota archaeon]